MKRLVLNYTVIYHFSIHGIAIYTRYMFQNAWRRSASKVDELRQSYYDWRGSAKRLKLWLGFHSQLF